MRRRDFIKAGALWLPAAAHGQALMPFRRGAGSVISGGGGGGGYAYDAVNFDGANDYMRRGADLTGNADSKLGAISLWMKRGAVGNTQIIYVNSGQRMELFWDSSNLFRVSGYNSSGTQILNMRTLTAYSSTSTWYHVLAAWDMADTAKRYIYVNDVSDLNTTTITYTDAPVDYTRVDHSVGDNLAAANLFNGCFSELWLAWGQHVDFSVAANRRKFDDGGSPLKPVDLGSDGSIPTGTAPIIYFKNAFGTFQTNLGSGGNFTVTGALTACADEP